MKDALYRKYVEYNRSLFGGALPPVPIAVRPLKALAGKVNYTIVCSDDEKPNPVLVRLRVIDKYANATIKPGTLRVSISNLFHRSEQAVDGILLHEMVHVYFAVIGQFSENHGPAFRAKVHELSGKVGFEIPLNDDLSGVELTQATTKPVGVILVAKGDGSHWVSLFQPTKLPDLVPAIAGRWLGCLGAPGDHVTIARIDSPGWTQLAARLPVQRTFGRSTRYWKLKPPDFGLVVDLREHGTVLETVTPS